MIPKSQRTGAILGGLFTLSVVGLLVKLHACDEETTDVVLEELPAPKDTWLQPPHRICDAGMAPTWLVLDVAAEEAEWWKGSGCLVESVTVGPCPDTCTFDIDQGKGKDPLVRTTPCAKGYTSMVLRDQWFDDGHAGEALLNVRGDRVLMFPEVIDAFDLDKPVADQPVLPANAKQLTVRHEMGHGFNMGHSYTPVVGKAVVAHQTGNAMNPSIFDAGDLRDGLGCGDGEPL